MVGTTNVISELNQISEPLKRQRILHCSIRFSYANTLIVPGLLRDTVYNTFSRLFSVLVGPRIGHGRFLSSHFPFTVCQESSNFIILLSPKIINKFTQLSPYLCQTKKIAVLDVTVDTSQALQ
jgi:hypothetical protein